MVRDLGRAPSGLPPSQGRQPDRRERDMTHSTSASDLCTTPSTAGGGRPPPHPRKSSGSGAGASGSMSSGGRTPGVTIGAASRGSTPQTSNPVTTSALTPSIPAAPATVVRGSIGKGSRGGPSGEGPSGEGPSGPTIPPIDISDIFEARSNTTTLTMGQMHDLIGRIFDVKLQQFASEMGLGSTPSRSGGGASTEQEDTTRRRRSRSSHADDAEPRSRRSKRSSRDADRDRRSQPVPLVELELDEYGIPEGDSLSVLGTMVREVCRLYLPDDAIWSAVPVNQRYQILDIATRLAAKYGPISVRHKNAKARLESRREKNIMVTNPYGHQGFGGFRARFMKKFGVYPEPKHNAFLRLYGMKRVFEFMRTGREFPEVGGPSNAEVGADDTSGADDGADGAAAGSDVGADDDGAERSELEGSGDSLRRTTKAKHHSKSDSSRFEIREALRAPVQPALTEAQRIIRFVTGGESSALRTLPHPSVLQAIPLDPPSGVLRAIPRDPQPSVARTVTPQPSAARAVVSDPSRAQPTVPEPRQTRAQSQVPVHTDVLQPERIPQTFSCADQHLPVDSEDPRPERILPEVSSQENDPPATSNANSPGNPQPPSVGIGCLPNEQTAEVITVDNVPVTSNTSPESLHGGPTAQEEGNETTRKEKRKAATTALVEPSSPSKRVATVPRPSQITFPALRSQHSPITQRRSPTYASRGTARGQPSVVGGPPLQPSATSRGTSPGQPSGVARPPLVPAVASRGTARGQPSVVGRPPRPPAASSRGTVLNGEHLYLFITDLYSNAKGEPVSKQARQDDDDTDVWADFAEYQAQAATNSKTKKWEAWLREAFMTETERAERVLRMIAEDKAQWDAIVATFPYGARNQFDNRVGYDPPDFVPIPKDPPEPPRPRTPPHVQIERIRAEYADGTRDRSLGYQPTCEHGLAWEDCPLCMRKPWPPMRCWTDEDLIAVAAKAQFFYHDWNGRLAAEKRAKHVERRKRIRRIIWNYENRRRWQIITAIEALKNSLETEGVPRIGENPPQIKIIKIFTVLARSFSYSCVLYRDLLLKNGTHDPSYFLSLSSRIQVSLCESTCSRVNLNKPEH
ncbi:hypothetical protein R1sor_010710 [Riccia sorocarpa]|uniref:Uncharacterized protein n=1 Tax=Riccia sorocarpa TaxID=122646 RepID=A0ABD3I4W2_9MARC